MTSKQSEWQLVLDALKPLRESVKEIFQEIGDVKTRVAVLEKAVGMLEKSKSTISDRILHGLILLAAMGVGGLIAYFVKGGKP